jgi:hypothetical protein
MFMLDLQNRTQNATTQCKWGGKKKSYFPEHHPHFTPPLLASAFSVINTLALHQPDPIAFMPVEVDTSGRIYDDFSRLQFLHDHRSIYSG